MEAFRWPALCGLICLVSYLTTAFSSTFVVERPTHTAVVSLACAGLVLLTIRSPPGRHRRSASDRELQDEHLLRQPDQPAARRAFNSLLRLLNARAVYERSSTSIIILITALIIRVESIRFLLQHVECTGRTFETFLPAVVAILDLLLSWRHQKLSPVDRTGKDHHIQNTRRSSNRQYALSLLLTSAICISSTIASHSFAAPQSSYICATSAPYIWMTPLAQHIGTVLDSTILICMSRILSDDYSHAQYDMDAPARTRGVALSLLCAASIISFTGLLQSAMVSGGFAAVVHLSGVYLISLAKVTALTSCLCLCFVITVLHFGVQIATVVPVVAAVATSTISHAKTFDPTSPTSYEQLGTRFAAIVATAISSILFLRLSYSKTLEVHSASRRSLGRGFLLMQLGVVALLAVHAYFWTTNKPKAFSDPFRTYLDDAATRQESFAAGANSSTSLFLAVEEYRSRYNRYPPPHFDVWYKYATARQSVIIDAYDGLWQDILPFYALEPAEIRTRTRDLIIDSRNDIAGVSIRDGRAHPGLNIAPRNQWMIEAVVNVINKFAEHLPDMDLAFNMNDANRVAVPYERLSFLQRTSQSPIDGPEPTNQFQPGRSTHWLRLSGSERNDVMEELGPYDNVFRFATAGCPSDSPARREHFWNVQAACPQCAVQHDPAKPFDICLQPDLQHLHGLYSSPAVFKATRKLYPVFSAARAPGFNDIVYPSMWDYMDKSVHAPSKQHPDPSWTNKTSDIFWRGSTTEGISDGKGASKWQGMLRQRFVHLINNIKGSAPPATILLKDGVLGTYSPVLASNIENMLQADVKLTPDIARCQGRDCDLQRWEFAPTPNLTDFQDHWQHKYLLDMDGPTASTRILPFLRSQSLPFRASIIQEWWHDRVMPWVHYVPIDIRGHDFWTSLAWFTGMSGAVVGQQIQLESHDAEAERIALTGKRWAEAALRKEDMEIYFFRLLLEWARITDDWRDDIGFTGVNK